MKKINPKNRHHQTRHLLNDHKNKPENMQATTKVGIIESKLIQPPAKTQKPEFIKNHSRSFETQKPSPRKKLS